MTLSGFKRRRTSVPGDYPRKKKRKSPRIERLPDMDLMGRGYGVYHVTCKMLERDYDAAFDSWNKKHGFLCAKCGQESPLDCPDHVVEYLGRKA